MYYARVCFMEKYSGVRLYIRVYRCIEILNMHVNNALIPNNLCHYKKNANFAKKIKKY